MMPIPAVSMASDAKAVRPRGGGGFRGAALGLMAAGLAACATGGGAPGPRNTHSAEGAISQPFRDLSLMREATPEVLTRAAAAPYAAPAPLDCPAMAAEVAGLDAALGPDIDRRAVETGWQAEEMVWDALRSAIGLPFRGVIRRISGAEKFDRTRARAVLSGMVRRGFLKGWSRAADCPAP